MRMTHPQIRAAQESLYVFSRSYFRNPARGGHMLIYGENGAGKSRLVKLMSKWAYECAWQMPRVPADERDIQDGKRTASSSYVKFPKLIHDMPRDWDRDWIKQLCEAPNCPNLLVLDDIGADHDPKGFGAAQLYLLLEQRAQMWTLMTTNCSPDQWEAKWDRRVASRLLRDTTIISMDQVPDFSSVKEIVP